MTHQVTIYSSPTPLGHIVRSGSGTYQPRAAMWNTVTNLLRIMNLVDYILCLATCDEEFLLTVDDEFLTITS